MSAHHLFDYAIDKMRLKNDAALCGLIGVLPPVVSKMRHQRLPVGATAILALHEHCDIPLATIRALIAQ